MNWRIYAAFAFAFVVAGIASVLTANAPVRIPLCKGLTIVTAINDKNGDYESIKRIESVTPDAVSLRFDSDHPPGLLDVTGSSMVHTTMHRIIRRTDLESAHEYMQLYDADLPQLFPRTTAIGISREALNDLRTKGSTALTTYQMQAPPKDWQPHVKADRVETDWSFNPKRVGRVRRVEPKSVTVRVIVNDRPLDLPAIHAAGQVAYTKHDLYVLDDPDNPLALRFQFGTDALTVIKIAFPPCGEDAALGGAGGRSGSGTPGSSARGQLPAGGATVGSASGGRAGGGSGSGRGDGDGSRATTGAAGADAGPRSGGIGSVGDADPAPQIARALADEGHADVYGIYFDFNSDRIKEESEPVLRQIAIILDRNRAWKLELNGHTDNIGDAPYNLDLSTRRAAAVKQALVSRYSIDSARLATNGFGASMPKATNDTLEGRAQNRRVELVRR
jgi:outer membrane protein OmpA-like peptidoglycan-associated protein